MRFYMEVMFLHELQRILGVLIRAEGRKKVKGKFGGDGSSRLDSYAQFAAPSSDEALYCVLGAVVQFNFNKPVVTYTHLLTGQAGGGGRNY